MNRPPEDATARRLARVAPAIVIGVALVAYAATLMPGMAFDDWGEMQTVPHVLGVAHPTGYPTYVLLAWLFGLLPIGSVAWRSNLLSAVCVAVALGALTAIGQRVGVRWWLAVLAALATGAIATVWGSAVVAEVNPLHLALMALLIHRSLVWADERRLRDLALGGLIVGLGAGNHLLTLFVAPFFVVFALWAGRHALREHPVWLLAPIAAGAAGLAVYLYIPLAALGNPPLPYNHPVTFEGIRFLVTGEQFRGQFSGLFTTDSIGPLTSSLPGLVELASSRATPLFPILGLLGLGLLVRRRVAFGLACWGALIAGIDVWANYLHLEHYLLVPWLLLGIGVGVTLDAAVNGAGRVVAGRNLARPAALVAGVIGAVLVAVLVVANVPGANRSDDETARQYVDSMFAELPPNTAVFTYWAASPPLWHATMVEGQRPDLLVVDDTNIVYEGWGTREKRIESVICDRPVYVMRPNESELIPTRAAYTLVPAFTVFVGRGSPSASQNVQVYRVVPPEGQCPA